MHARIPFLPLLAIDAAAAQCAIAVIGKGVEATRVQPQQRGGSDILLPMIQELLRHHGLAVADLAAIAVTTGPGSFTGLRAGLAAAQGLSLALAIPGIGIDSFAAFAASLPESEEASHLDRVVIVESRRAELYWQRLTADGTPLSEPAGALPPDIASALLDDSFLLCGDACESVATLLPGRPAIVQKPGPDPLALARLGLKRLGEIDNPSLPQPLYVRAPDATPKRPGPTGAKQ